MWLKTNMIYARLEQEIAVLPHQEGGRFQGLSVRRGQATSAAPVHEVQKSNMGMFVKNQLPYTLGQEKLTVFINKKFRIWACSQRCDEALEIVSIVKTGEVTDSFLEEMRGKQLVGQSYMIWEALNKEIEKEDVILSILIKIGSPSKARRALVKVATETNDAATYRTQKDEEAGEYYARVNVLLSVMQKYGVNISQGEIHRHVLSLSSPRFSADVKYFARERFKLTDLKVVMARVESFQSEFE